jgi:hypothetical protein
MVAVFESMPIKSNFLRNNKMAFRRPEAKEAALKSVDELIHFAQYVKTLVQGAPLGADQLARITNAIPEFEQQIIHDLGDLYRSSSGDLPKATVATPPAAKVAGKSSGKAAAKSAVRQRAKPAFRDDDTTDYLAD